MKAVSVLLKGVNNILPVLHLNVQVWNLLIASVSVSLLPSIMLFLLLLLLLLLLVLLLLLLLLLLLFVVLCWLTKITAFLDVTLCRLADAYRRFRRTSCVMIGASYSVNPAYPFTTLHGITSQRHCHINLKSNAQVADTWEYEWWCDWGLPSVGKPMRQRWPCSRTDGRNTECIKSMARKTFKLVTLKTDEIKWWW
jgi:hypothetical protein